MSPRGQMSFGVPPFTKGVKWIAVPTLILSILATVERTAPAVGQFLAFQPATFWRGYLWTAFTYPFLLPGPMELIFGLLALWLVGASLESRWGTRRFLTFYFATGAIGAVATALVGFLSARVAAQLYYGNWAPIEGLIAATAIQMPTATFFLYFFPVQARWMLPISAGITLLYMIMGNWAAYLPQLFALGAGVLLAGGISPDRYLLRLRVWWIDRKMRRSKLRVVRDDDDTPLGGLGSRGSDKFLH